MMAVRHLIASALLATLLVFGSAALVLGADPDGFLANDSPSIPAGTTTDWRLVVSGNQRLPEAQLLKSAQEELALFAKQGHAASAIDDAAFQMELTYHHAGYPAAVVDYEIKAETRQVFFQVQEGARLLIKDIIFEGNQGLARDRLLALDALIKEALAKHQSFPYVVETIDTLIGSIRTLYLAEGYLEIKAQVLTPEVSEAQADPEPINLTIILQEGPRFKVGEVSVHGDIPPSLSAKIAAIISAMQGAVPSSPAADAGQYPSDEHGGSSQSSLVLDGGKVYQRRQKLLLKTQLHDCYENAGYADVTVTVFEEIDPQKSLVRLFANVDSGKPATVKGIQISGNERTSKDFILSRLQLELDAQYRLDDKRDSFSQLYQTGLFSSVELRLVDAGEQDSGQKMVEVEVQERKVREIYLEPGWGSYELLRLKSGYKDSNIFGSGRILRFDSAISIMGRSLEVGVSDPWFLGSDITVGLPFHYRYRTEPAFTMETSGADLYLLKTIHKKVTVNMDYQYSKNVVTDIGPDLSLLGLATNYNTASLSGQLTRDTRDDMFFPTTGYRGNVALSIARPSFGGTIAYNRLLTGVRYFYPLTGGSIVGLRFNTGMILPAGDQQSIPVGERFFNGGESSVRSFQASQLGPVDAKGDPLGGTAFSTYTVEWRKKFTQDLAWSLFFDMGNVAPNRTMVNGQSPLALDADTLIQATWRDYLSDFRSGVGTGIQYMLPVGPARLDLAFNPDRDPARNEADYVVHFSIGMAF